MDKSTSTAAQQPPDLGAANDHPMFDIPFTADVDGRRFQGTGISLVEAFATGLLDPQLAGESRLVKLAFAFSGFSVGLLVNATVSEADGGQGKVRIAFADPTGEHLPQLRHILNSYVAGDLISLGGTIGVASTAGSGDKPASAANPAAARKHKQLGTAATIAASVALVIGATSLLYQRAYSIAVPTPAYVMQSGETLRAVSSGQIDYLNLAAAAAAGEIAFAIRATSGETLSIAMPCDCAATLAGVEKGSTVLAGEPVLYLAQDVEDIAVGANVPPELLYDLAAAHHIELTLANGDSLRAMLDTSQQHDVAGEGDKALIPVTLTPDTTLDPDQVGQVVRLRIHKPAPWIFAPFQAVAGLVHRMRTGAAT